MSFDICFCVSISFTKTGLAHCFSDEQVVLAYSSGWSELADDAEQQATTKANA